MKKSAPVAVLVSRAIGFRVHATSREKVFAYTQGRSEVVFTVSTFKGTLGRPRNGSPGGFGINTKVSIKVLGNRGKKVVRRQTVTLADLVNGELVYLGTKKTVFGGR
jgi:hypothetical protein